MIKVITVENLAAIPLMFFFAVWVEKYYVPRIGILPNLFVVLVSLVPKWDTLPSAIQYWLIIGVIFGVIGILAYMKVIPPIFVHKIFYSLSYLLYSLKTILGIYIGILLWGVPTGLYAGGAISIGIWFIGVRYFSNKPPLTR